VILSVIGDRIGVDNGSVEILTAAELQSGNRKTAQVPTKISVIPVYGSLAFRSMGLMPESGLTTYDDIRNDFEAAGLMDLVDEIYNARGDKPIYAVANESTYSAAYAIASAADVIFMSRSAGVGSVGVIALHRDQVQFDKDMGLKYTTIFAGARKNDFNPHQALSSEAREILQDEVFEHYALFTQTVARNRDMKVAQVKSTEAGVFMGEKAVAVGFADEVKSFGLAIEGIANGRKAIVAKTQDTQVVLLSEPKQEKEVKEMDFAEFTKEHPELLAEITTMITDRVTTEQTVKFDAEKLELEGKLAQERDGFSDERTGLKKEINVLQKKETIRTEKELKLDAHAIWVEKLSESDIPDRLFVKVETQVRYESFVENDTLDRDAFKAAIDTEIQDWIDRGVTSEAEGFGVSVKTVDENATKQAKEEKDDDAEADRMFTLSGGDRKEVK